MSRPDWCPLVAMTEDERICFDRAMEQWLASCKRPDMTEEDRIKGALLAYQRQAFVLNERALLSAKREGMEDAAEIAEGKSREFDEQAALAECRDAEYGFHNGRIAAAEVIRQKAQEIGK